MHETQPSGELTFSSAGFRTRNLFPTSVFVAPVNEAVALNGALKPLILERSMTEPSVSRSNSGGWQSTDDFTAWGGEAGARLTRAVRALASGVTGIQQQEGEFSQVAPDWRMNAWANINRRGDSNTRHHHAGAFWSAVYWVDAGETAEGDVGGEFEMFDPRGILPTFYAPTLRVAAPGYLSAGASEFLVPQTGTLILFPSWLAHSVRPYTGERPRLSIAFNLSV